MFKDLTPVLHNPIQKIEVEGTLPNSFYETSITSATAPVGRGRSQEWQVQAVHVVSTDTLLGGGRKKGRLLWVSRVEVLAPDSAFSDTTLVGVLQHFVAACLVWNSKPATEHLLLELGVGSQIFLWCLAGLEQFLKNVFFLARLPLSWPFG